MKFFVTCALGAALIIAGGKCFQRLTRRAPPRAPAKAMAVVTAKPQRTAARAPQASSTFNLASYIEQTRRELKQIEARSKALESTQRQLHLQEKRLQGMLKGSATLKEVLANPERVTRDNPTIQKLYQVASSVRAVAPPGQPAFAKISNAGEKILIDIEANNLFRNLMEPSALQTVQLRKLTALIANLPRGLRLRTVTLYQSATSADPLMPQKSKALEQFFRMQYGRSVDEIQVRLTKRNVIPGNSEFLIQLAAEPAPPPLKSALVGKQSVAFSNR